MVKFLDLNKQYILLKDEIDKSILSVINDSSFIGGKYVLNFENEFSEYLNINNCVGVANGTDALEIAIESFDFNKGQEIIVPANSWISSSEAVTRNGNQGLIKFLENCIKMKKIHKDILKKRLDVLVNEKKIGGAEVL